MFNLIKQFKREFVYVSYIFLTLELLVTKQYVVSPLVYLGTSLIGLILIFSWFLTTLKLFGMKKVSKKSVSNMSVNLKARLFSYIIMPVVFWFSIALFLFFNENMYIAQTVIVVSSSLFFLLMLRIRSSMEKVYFVDSMTRFVYDFCNIVIFYLLLSVLNRVGFRDIYLVPLVTLFAFLSLQHMLYVYRKMETTSTIVAVVASILIAIILWGTRNMNIYMQPAIVTAIYYLIVSLWNVRFSGSRKLEDYIPALMYTLMSIILILSL